MSLTWGVFFSLVSVIILQEIYFLRKRTVTFRQSCGQVLTVFFAVFVTFLCLIYQNQHSKAVNFITAYFVEFSLSLDNVFVFYLIFQGMAVPKAIERRVLIWGVLLALVLRGLFLLFGLWLLTTFSWVLYPFGLLLIITGFKALRSSPNDQTVGFTFVHKLKEFLPVTEAYASHHFSVVVDNKRHLTPLFFVLLSIAGADVIFAIDSIPAVLSISTNLFVIYAANVYAVLGLRSLYVLVSDFISRFAYLHISIAVVLIFIGLKIFLTNLYHIPQWFSLAFVLSSIFIGIACSVRKFR